MADEQTVDRDDLEGTETTDTTNTTDTSNTSDSDTNTDNSTNFESTDFDKSGVDPEEFDRTRKALAKANKEAEARRKKLKEWEELGVDPDKVKKLLEEQRTAERKRMEDEGRYRELLEELEEVSNKEKLKIQQEADEKITRMRSNLEKYFVDRTIAEAIAEEGANSKILNPHIRSKVKVVESDDGEFQTVIVDENGSPRLKRGGSYMTVKDLLGEMKSDDAFAVAFPAPSTSGAGSTSASSGRTVSDAPTGIKRRDMSVQERAAYRAKYGKEAYEKLPL